LTNVKGFYSNGNRWFGNAKQNPQGNASLNNFDIHFNIDEQNNLNSSLAGAVKVTGNFASGGVLLYQYNPADYTVASGDKLKFEIYCDEAAPSFRPTAYIQFSDASGSTPLFDQNGVSIYDDEADQWYSDLRLLANGRWYAREFDLTAYAGKTSRFFKFGYIGQDSSQVGVHTFYIFYIRNIRVVDNSGALKQTFYVEGIGLPSLASNSNVTAYSAPIYTPPNTARFGIGSSTPADNTNYDLFLNTTTHHILGWSGSAWLRLDN